MRSPGDRPQQLSTRAIILSRVDYGEADRIITVLTSGHGKLALIAKGVRREKSKLAGGIELFSVSELSILKGRGEVSTLTSSRLETHYGNIVKDFARTSFAYEVLKSINKITEYDDDDSFFELLRQTLMALDMLRIALEIVQVWYAVQLLGLLGHEPNLSNDATGQPLAADKTYTFDTDTMSLLLAEQGAIGAADIKFLRLARGATPVALARVNGGEEYARNWQPFILSMLQQAHVA